MIVCKSKFGYVKCVCEMDAQQSKGGTIVCDFAEDCNYDKEEILRECELAELVE